jgi:hypothetical protein
MSGATMDFIEAGVLVQLLLARFIRNRFRELKIS